MDDIPHEYKIENRNGDYMKKIVSLLLSFTLIFSLSAPVVAVDNSPQTGNGNPASEDISHTHQETNNDTEVTENVSVRFIEADENGTYAAVRPNKSKAIVILPGTIGSKLFNSNGSQVWDPGLIDAVTLKSVLPCNTSGFSENVIRVLAPSATEYGAQDTYKTLVQSLNNNFSDEYDVLFFSYDWRLDVKGTAGQVKDALQYYTEVVLVCHSMGGIVGSAYVRQLLDAQAARPRVTKMITMGTPYTGAAKAIHVMETGELIANSSGDGYLLTGTLKELAPNYTSLYQLLPTEDYSTRYLYVGSTSKTHTQARSVGVTMMCDKR